MLADFEKDTRAIFDAVTAIAPGGTRVAVEPIRPLPCAGQLHPAEQKLIENAAQKRRAEFTAGRVGARRALAQLGHENYTLLPGDKRQPLWPQGVAGSISHHGRHAIAVVANKKEVDLIGVDLASDDALKPRLIKTICTEQDRIHIEKFGVNNFPMDPYKSVFSIKESIYKCLYPAVKKVFGFHDVTVKFTPQSPEVDVDLINQSLFPEQNMKLLARVVLVENYIVSIAWHSVAVIPE